MKRTTKLASATVLMGTLLLLAFNNCGKVQFGPGSDASTAAAPKDDLVHVADENDEQEQQAESQEDEPKIPLAEIDADPNLLENYKCPFGAGYQICHFPNDIKDKTTVCISASAIKTHYSHIRDYTEKGESKTIFDYLGPCR